MTAAAQSRQLPPHSPGAGRRLLSEVLGRELPEISEEEKRELLTRLDVAGAEARRYYGERSQPA